MPPFPERESSILAKLKKKRPDKVANNTIEPRASNASGSADNGTAQPPKVSLVFCTVLRLKAGSILLQRGHIACNAERCISHGNAVCLPHAGTLSRWMKIGSHGVHCDVAKTVVFCYQRWLGTTSLTLSHTYNISTVRASEKKSIIANSKSTTRFPTSYRWSPYVTPDSPKGWLKKRICHFLIFL